MAVRYGTLRICVLRTLHQSRIVRAYRTSVQFLKRTVPTYRSLLLRFLRTVTSINLGKQRSMNDICDLCCFVVRLYLMRCTERYA